MLLRQVKQQLAQLARCDSPAARCMCTRSPSIEHASPKDDRKQKQAYIKQMAANQSEAARPADWDSAKPYSEIPGPKPVPVLGNIWRFLPVVGNYYGLDQISQHTRFFQEYGKIMKLSGLKLRNDIIVLFDPDSIEYVYRNEGVWPHREGLESLIYYKVNIRDDIFQGEGGVLTGHGEKWYYARSVVNPPMMQPRSAKMYMGPMNNVADDFIERIRVLEKKHPNGEMPEDFSNELNKWALESICVIGLNKRLGLLDPVKEPNPEAQNFITDVLDLFLLLNELDVKPSLWRWISTPTWKRYVKTLDKITEFEMKNIDEAIAKMAEYSGKERSQAEMSILEQLLKRDKKVAFAMVFDMLIAGIDTTSRTSAAALYYLSVNPKVQSKLREELRSLLPQKDSPITAEILNKMHYLKAVIKETTRLAPIAVGNIRRLPRDLVILGYQVPKGTDVLNAHMYLSRQEKYFPKANDFIPDRWLRQGGEEWASKDTNPFVFMPFGFGPRSCIGRRLAQLEMEVVLAKIVRNFDLSWPHEEMKWIMNMLYGVGSPLKYCMKSLKD